MAKIDLNVAERRSESRFDIGNETVQVDLLGDRGLITCCIWNLSPSGACLFLPSNTQLSERFNVLLADGPRTAVQVWRKLTHIGVKFVDQLGDDET